MTGYFPGEYPAAGPPGPQGDSLVRRLRADDPGCFPGVSASPDSDDRWQRALVVRCLNQSDATSVSLGGAPLMDEPIGIIGAGRLGQALARTVRRAGRLVVIANSRGPESLAAVVDALGAGVTPGTTQDATRCSIVALAVPWAGIHEALSGLNWSGEIVIDATNAVLL